MRSHVCEHERELRKEPEKQGLISGAPAWGAGGLVLEGVMSRSDRTRNEPAALKPIGFALAAVVAGLGSAKADRAATLVSPPPPTPEPPAAASAMLASFAPDDVLVLDTPLDAAGVPLAEPATPSAQGDLFDPDVPLGGAQ